MGRTKNCVCQKCGKKFYKRPSQIKKYKHSFCSRKCFGEWKIKWKNWENKNCNAVFNPKRREQKFCRPQCAAVSRKPRSKNGFSLTRAESRLKILKDLFDLKSCMVDGCEYDITYDVHRLVAGKDGGKYEVGNMFAICPNHHAEIHRGISKPIKIDDYTLLVNKCKKNEEKERV